jgi:hypothetical protein
MKTKSMLISALVILGIPAVYAQSTTTQGAQVSPQPTTPATEAPANNSVQNPYGNNQTPATVQPNPYNTTQPSPYNPPAEKDPLHTTDPQKATDPSNSYTQPATSPANTQFGGTNSTTTGTQSTVPAANDVIKVQSDQIPSGLKQTLQDPAYQGWENSTIYLNRNTNVYSLDIGTGNNLKTYRFDENGSPMKPNGGQ